MLTPALVFAQPPGGGAGLVGNLLPIILMVAIVWFLLFRPQQREQQRHREMVRNLKKGDEVVTIGGLYGKIMALTDEKVSLRIADNVKVDVERSKVARVLTPSIDKKVES